MQVLGNLIEQASARMESPLESLAWLVKDVKSVQIDQGGVDKGQQKFRNVAVQGNQNSPQLHQKQQGVNAGAQNAKVKSVPNRMTFGEFMNRSVQAIVQKQQKAVQQMVNNFSVMEANQTTAHSQPQLNVQKLEEQISGEQLQRLNKKAEVQEQSSQKQQKINQACLNQQLQQQVENNFSFAKPSSSLKVQQTHQYCQQIRNNFFNQNFYTQPKITGLINQISQTQKNNSYRCLQSSFQLLKSLFHTNSINKTQNKSLRKNSSTRNIQSGGQFNLQLTMRSKLSKQSGTHIDRQDSLVYSNATSFGLNARSKQVSRQNSSTRLVRPEELDEIIHIEKTSSKGEVDNTENEFSVKSLSDTEPLKNIPKNKRLKNSANRSQQQSVRSKSSRGAMAPTSNNDFLSNQPIHPATLIHQQHDYQILPLTQQPHHQPSPKKANINTFGLQTPQKPIKKSFSIKTYTNNKTNNSRTTQKHSEEASVFSAEISQLQSRISKIKETKLLRKMRLEEELKKVNMEIQQLKIQQEQQQENTHQSHAKHKSSHVSSKQKSAYQSRIKINDDIQQKKKAANLVKNLRQQKISRQNQKQNQHKAFNADLHQQMQDIMKMKYFNQQRIKQKRQLQIIERMKQQEVRKIVEQKQKQQSVVFLAKLRNGEAVGESKVERVQKVESKVELKSKKTQDSPVKKTQEREIIQPMSNPALEKKKIYMKKMRNFTIIKKGRDDLYQQALN